ncbi:TolC family outer membrane protein [Thiomicrorhabdus xiamenensis]|uniref:TolC family outer membrane protein n=1 Tax=Thiomicrorhabdus xiamenensis TaxID=2739063 RepID=A0A7D4P4X2_9GAMM|nr:TolC family outer membrane protein [Thiomicrorhabdus xiamenensis]QKI89496.1 TolC family outer membrane protein [Thiomicrorhabdus xiamenensis]
MTTQPDRSFIRKGLKFLALSGMIVSMPSLAVSPAPMSPNNLNDTIQYAIDKNPEVQAQWHNFLASQQDTNSAESEYRPNLDFFADYAFMYKSYTQNERYDGASAKLSLTQMLYDGHRTEKNTESFKNTELVRYFELLSSVENTALDTYTAYQDVLRYRKLTEIAQQNYQNHLDVYKKIAAGVETGATRRADLEQISGRLALAESNLLTEKANLHDVSARFLRIVGSIPSKDLANVDFDENTLPTTFDDVMNNAYQHNAAFHAAIRNIDAKRSSVERERAGFKPRLDLVGEYGAQTYDLEGNDDATQNGRLALEFRYNIYNGKRTDSQVQRALEEVSRATYLREKACVDMRQNLQISFNDVRKLNDQMPILNQHLDASDKVRVAFKDQFSIGQRTLLDLLDTEIEYFQAGRAYANAVYDRNISTAKTLAEMGLLLSTLNIVKGEMPSLADLGAEEIPVDPETTCPIAQIPDLYGEVEHPGPLAMPKATKFEVPAADDADGNTYRLTVNFKYNSSIIDQSYANDIAELAQFMKDHPDTKVEIQGHASLEGPDTYNQWLSERRAEAVATELVKTHQIEKSRVSSVGFGETQPIINAMTPEAHKANRRVESKITLIVKE